MGWEDIWRRWLFIYCFLLNRLLTFHWEALGNIFEIFQLLKMWSWNSSLKRLDTQVLQTQPPHRPSPACVYVCGCALRNVQSLFCTPIDYSPRLLFLWNFWKNNLLGSLFSPPIHWSNCVSTSPERRWFFPLVPPISYLTDAPIELGEEKQAQKIMPWEVSLQYLYLWSFLKPFRVAVFFFKFYWSMLLSSYQSK